MATGALPNAFSGWCAMRPSSNRHQVVFLPAWYPSEDNPVLGIFVREHAMAASLHDDVVVLYVRPATERIAGLYVLTDEMEAGLRTIRITHRRSPLPGTARLLWFCLYWIGVRRLIADGVRPDVLHAHVYHAGVPAVLLGRLLGVPVVLTEHTSAFPRGTLNRFRMRLARFAMERASMVLPVSEHLRHCIEAHGIQARFRVVPNAVPADVFYPAGADERNTGARRVKRLLMVGLLTPVKGIPYLLEALHALRQRRQDFVLDVVGDGASRADYETLTCELGLANVVRFRGLRAKPEIAACMRRCDIFVLPSLFETFGVAVAEALASGKPVVASDIEALREVVTAEVGCLVPPGDAGALADALDRMLDRYRTYRPHGLAHYIRERYSREVVGTMLHAIYREVVEGRSHMARMNRRYVGPPGETTRS
jgi:glycosyltransferase involved in cell wall biosynthesis